MNSKRSVLKISDIDHDLHNNVLVYETCKRVQNISQSVSLLNVINMMNGVIPDYSKLY